MSGFLEPLLQIFENVIQGALSAITLLYIVSTQRRWMGLMVDPAHAARGIATDWPDASASMSDG